MDTPRLSRRRLLQAGALAGAGLALPNRTIAAAIPAASRRAAAAPPPAPPAVASDRLRKFVAPIRRVGTDIPLATPDAVNPGWWQPGVTHYTMDLAEFDDRLHPDLDHATRLWGFGQGATDGFRHLGGVVAVKRGSPVQITFRNRLPRRHILPVDRTIMGTEGPDNRASVHVHGGRVPWTSDGGPHAWWDPAGHRGKSFLNNAVLRHGQSVPPNEAEFFYPNDQGSRLIWYHDHALGITRLNAYAGLASGYVLIDDYEDELERRAGLPDPLDVRTEYLVFQDKVLVPRDVAAVDPRWLDIVSGSRSGDLWYGHVYDGTIGPHPAGDPRDLPVSCVPEFFGDTILVNGTVYPFLEVEPREYRFRLLNASNSRFLDPRLVFARGTGWPEDTEPGTVAGPAFVQIQNEGGFLPRPVRLDGSPSSRLLLAPGERADLIVDFRDVPVGSRLILVNTAPGPFPTGARPTGSAPGFGPDTRTLLQVRVNRRRRGANRPIRLPALFEPTDAFEVHQRSGVPTPVPHGTHVRFLTLNEGFDEFGRLTQRLGTDRPPGPASEGFGRSYADEPTEVVREGSLEAWEILNLTADTHPIHFHLVNVQVLSRQPIDVAAYHGGRPTYTGAARAPHDSELGWKETVRMNPGEATRVLMRFALPPVPFHVPPSPRTGGNEYVWHCHMLEHEEHDMMRALIVG